MKKNVIAILTKAPIPGLSKTRLSPPFSLTQCVFLSFCFLSDLIYRLRKIKEKVDIFIFYTPKEGEKYLQPFRKIARLERERGKTLGEKIKYICKFLLSKGYEKIIIICSDSPNIPLQYIIKGFKLISQKGKKIVFDPTKDGAAYLIGFNLLSSCVVNNIEKIDWEDNFSLKKIVKKLKKQNVSISSTCMV